jgi:ribosome-binding protein aMBF1 (putative translation factor)
MHRKDNMGYSPIGASVAEVVEKKREDLEYRAAYEEQWPYEQFARLVIHKRMQLGLTQEELAKRMGTSNSVVSRLEGGQHRFSFATMRKLAKALETHLVYGFQDEAPDSQSRRTPKRDLVVV